MVIPRDLKPLSQPSVLSYSWRLRILRRGWSLPTCTIPHGEGLWCGMAGMNQIQFVCDGVDASVKGGKIPSGSSAPPGLTNWASTNHTDSESGRRGL